MTINVAEVNAALTLVSSVSPVLMTAYQMFKLIWLRTNPGKTEADFLSYLKDASQANVDESAAILLADGFVEVTPGNWVRKPATQTS